LPGNSPEQARGHLLDSFDEVADYAESAGVEVDIEEPGLLVECTDEVLELIDDVGSDALGVNLDIGHAAAYGEDPTEGVRKYAGNITGVHLKDIAGGRRGNIITESLAKAISIQERFLKRWTTSATTGSRRWNCIRTLMLLTERPLKPIDSFEEYVY